MNKATRVILGSLVAEMAKTPKAPKAAKPSAPKAAKPSSGEQLDDQIRELEDELGELEAEYNIMQNEGGDDDTIADLESEIDRVGGKLEKLRDQRKRIKD